MSKSAFARSLFAGTALVCAFAMPAQAADKKTFVFGSDAKPTASAVVGNGVYNAASGFGVEGTAPQLQKQSANGAFYYSVDVPEGNYKVTVTFGGDQASETTVKAELRRLMLERVKVPAKGSVTKTFIVNVRTPVYPGGKVKLKVPREVEGEARAWDARITLEFNGTPAVRAITVEPVTVPTLYVLGDSTVCDQSGEPYASWGQMFPRFFKPTVAVANHGESGESTFSSKGANRFDKIISLIKPGDYFIVQFGHNDQKSKDADAEQKYKAILIDWANQVKAKGGTAVIVSPMHRNRFEGGKVNETLGNYPQMAKEAAAESGAIFIDLHEKSRVLYETLGPKGTMALFMHNEDYSKKDGTHHGPYGAYELAKIVAQGLRDAKAPVASEIVADLPGYDPSKPLLEKDFKVPPSAAFTTERPLGVNQEQ
ncbi:rhamnogalacturonan acetylesterase [Asticcacaulis sp. BYS171W]|uniref:Rhamnogalacturonan acetylesterase n=1 Tax=Asticcacaulis aquaticus TaxID=2984212 RepID=A0ABT5HTU8_9CAUL|nr:rhamnogalacturonan acetylesterase [Asticcacaulis aquaticus]MDC7683492.1 rhamnogalacturonan acetylesterase [Asticcacaulis aquaticus]